MFDEQKKRDAEFGNGEYIRAKIAEFYTADDLTGARLETVVQDLEARLSDGDRYPSFSPEMVRRAVRNVFGLKAVDRETEDGRKAIFQRDAYRPIWN